MKSQLRSGKRILYSGKSHSRSQVSKQLLIRDLSMALRIVMRHATPFFKMQSTRHKGTVNVPESIPLLCHTDLIPDINHITGALSPLETGGFDEACLIVGGVYCGARYVFRLGNIHIPCFFSNQLTPLYAAGYKTEDCLHQGYMARDLPCDVYQSYMLGKGSVDIRQSVTPYSQIEDEYSMVRIESAAEVL